MNTQEFLSYLWEQDIRVWADGDQLRYSAPEGRVTPALRAELANRKVEMLTFESLRREMPLEPTLWHQEGLDLGSRGMLRHGLRTEQGPRQGACK